MPSNKDKILTSFFDKTLNTAAFHKLLMENSLRRAIERDELMLYYQPKIDMRKKQIIGCEALLRWQHPELGMISPTQFIPIAEDSGLIIELSNWALKAACVQMKQWQERGISLSVAVNISAKQFRQHGFAQYVRTVLEAMGIAPRLLKLELTESTLLEDVNEALITLSELCLSGIRISIDDFGTGYSSLAYLKKLPISELKIDRSFLKDIPYNQDDMAIINAILALAHSLSLDVVAEGVEHEEQVEFLLKHGCDVAQGFLYSKPISANAFEEFIHEWNIS
ncbi:putative bifunctional diguanylate cyclase/phosphodiesterase [Methylocucumis oryzae]|uniref:putative bifunctional diguanylate cyclase/phosphodiesterase n=1 Tax=Methylocucumis oryzae TaxID=1632867 RepID=UPI001EF9F9D2|nr:EAL domain-containing protein [Methylocucumis oryzae]